MSCTVCMYCTHVCMYVHPTLYMCVLSNKKIQFLVNDPSALMLAMEPHLVDLDLYQHCHVMYLCWEGK
jgi:hypothetical protein